MNENIPRHTVKKVKGKSKYPYAVMLNDLIVCATINEKWAQQICNAINYYVYNVMEIKDDNDL